MGKLADDNQQARGGTSSHLIPRNPPLEKTVGTEPDPPEYGGNDAFSLLEGRPPCRPPGFSAESKVKTRPRSYPALRGFV
jgi:hypothetical protein